MFFLTTLQACGSQRDALMAIHNATNGINWAKRQNWGTETDVCNWHGVKCNAQGLVTVLNMSNQNATGSLPSDIQCLPYLQQLILNNNNFMAQIPDETCNLQQLQHLEAANASLIGRVPNCICKMQNLHHLLLQQNNLTGWFPLCVDKMNELRSMNLTCNNLHGISSLVSNLPLIKELNAKCNTQIMCPSAGTNDKLHIACDTNECPECQESFIQCPATYKIGDCEYVSPTHTPDTFKVSK